MITDIQRRNQILRRINHNVGRNNKTLSFAGAWKDIDESVFDDFTEKLIRNRQKNRPRIDE